MRAISGTRWGATTGVSMVAIMAVVYVFTSAINIIFWRLAVTILIVLCQTEFANVDFICDDFGDIERCNHIGNCTVRPCGSVYNTSSTLL